MINVITRVNAKDVAGYCRWAFDEIGADQVILHVPYRNIAQVGIVGDSRSVRK